MVFLQNYFLPFVFLLLKVMQTRDGPGQSAQGTQLVENPLALCGLPCNFLVPDKCPMQNGHKSGVKRTESSGPPLCVCGEGVCVGATL